MKKVTIADVQVFDNESFLENYSTLIDVGITSGREDAVMQTLSFINDLKRLIENLKEDMAEEPDGCQFCDSKDKRIQAMEKNIEILNEIKGAQKAKIAELEKMLEQTGNQPDPAKMKVSE